MTEIIGNVVDRKTFDEIVSFEKKVGGRKSGKKFVGCMMNLLMIIILVWKINIDQKQQRMTGGGAEFPAVQDIEAWAILQGIGIG